MQELSKVVASHGEEGDSEYLRKGSNPFTTSGLVDNATAKDLAERFIRLFVDESVLLRTIRTVFTDAPSGEMAKLDISGYVVEKATENSASTETRKPTTTALDYVNKKFRAQMDITGEVAEDNIERDGGKTAFMDAFSVQVANNLEELCIEGDESISGTTDAERLKKTNDGLHVLTAAGTGTNLKSAGGTRVDWPLFKEAMTNLPTRYRRNLRNYRWMMSPNTVLDLKEHVYDRATSFGDSMFNNAGNLAPLGVDILEVPMLPEDLTVSGTGSTGTFIWLVDPRNFMHVVQRRVQTITEYQPRKDVHEVTVYGRNDFLVENTDAIVKITDVVLDPTAARYGA